MRVPDAQGDQVSGPRPNRSSYIDLVRAQTSRPTRPHLLRATTDVGPRSQSPNPIQYPGTKDDEHWELRHGWEEQYNSEEYLSDLNSVSMALRYAFCLLIL